MTSLEQRLHDRGMNYRVETRDRLVVLIPDGSGPPVRADLLELAREEGFTHVALELDPDGAALPGD